MLEFIKSKSFHIIGSFIVGFGLVAVLRAGCSSSDCIVQKAPPIDEVKSSTYQIGHKCYQFAAEPVDCPMMGVIEPFRVTSLVETRASA